MGSLPVVISPLELGLNNSEQKFGDYKIGYYKKFGSGVCPAQVELGKF